MRIELLWFPRSPAEADEIWGIRRGEVRGPVNGVCEAVGAGEKEPEGVSQRTANSFQSRVGGDLAVFQASEAGVGSSPAR